MLLAMDDASATGSAGIVPIRGPARYHDAMDSSSVRARRYGIAAVAAVASVLLFTACASGATPAEDYSGLPVSDHAGEADGHTGGSEGGEPEALSAMWLHNGAQLAVTISGSSSCPSVGRQLRVLDRGGEGNRVAVDLVERDADEICTMDYVPHTTVFWTPLDVTTTEPLVVEVGGERVTVPVK